MKYNEAREHSLGEEFTGGGRGQFTKGEFTQVGPLGGNWPGEFDRGEFTGAGGGGGGID